MAIEITEANARMACTGSSDHIEECGARRLRQYQGVQKSAIESPDEAVYSSSARTKRSSDESFSSYIAEVAPCSILPSLPISYAFEKRFRTTWI